MSEGENAEHEEIKDETHEFQDAEQEEIEGDEEGSVDK